MNLTANEFSILRTMRGNALESQALRDGLHQVGLRFCGVCEYIKDASGFYKDRRTKHGLRLICRCCDRRRRSRARRGMRLSMFTGSERGQRHRDSRTPAELQAIYDAGNAQRDQENWRCWYSRYKDQSRPRTPQT